MFRQLPPSGRASTLRVTVAWPSPSFRQGGRARQRTDSPTAFIFPHAQRPHRMNSLTLIRRSLLACLFLPLLATPGRAQGTPDQAAEMLINSARKAFNEKNYPFAVAR